MKVQVSIKAGAIYGASLGRHGVIDWKWSTICHMIAGEVLEVETAHLFADQFNIAPVTGADLDRMKEKLLTEWGADLYRQRMSSNTTDESKAVEALSGSGIRLTQNYIVNVFDDERPARYACGYCGAQTTDPAATGYWCNKCVGSEHLEAANLGMLQLVPIMERKRGRAPVTVPDELKALHESERVRLRTVWESKEHERRAGRLAKFLADQAQEHAKIDRKTAVISALYAAGIDAVKLGTVYYSHNDTAQIGAICTPALTADEARTIRGVLDFAGAAIPCKITIKGE